MQVKQRGVAIFFHDAAEDDGLRLPGQIVVVKADDVEHGGIVIEQRLEGFFGDDGEHGSVLFVPVVENARGARHVAQGAEARGHHVLVAYFGRITCHTDLPVE